MEFLLAILIGGLFAAAIYMILRRSIIKLIIGLSFLAHAANLLIFTLGRVIRGKAPLIEEGASTSPKLSLTHCRKHLSSPLS
jgi:multicomponent Na+:H+ antiporter subunit C